MANPEDDDFMPCEKCGTEFAETLPQECGTVCEECYNEWQNPSTVVQTYRIRRMYFLEHPSRIQEAGLTLEQAQAWCRDPETSSSTATSEAALAHTAKFGAWFDGYEEE